MWHEAANAAWYPQKCRLEKTGLDRRATILDQWSPFVGHRGFARWALPGQRTLIFISPGFIALTPEAMQAKSRVIDIAAQANVTVSALDARGLYTEMEDENKRLESRELDLFLRQSRIAHGDVMAQLAAGTGGTYFHNSNDFEGGGWP